MGTLLVAIGSFVGFIIAYHTYGRWLSKKIFNLDESAEVPSKQLQDNIDFQTPNPKPQTPNPKPQTPGPLYCHFNLLINMSIEGPKNKKERLEQELRQLESRISCQEREHLEKRCFYEELIRKAERPKNKKNWYNRKTDKQKDWFYYNKEKRYSLSSCTSEVNLHVKKEIENNTECLLNTKWNVFIQKRNPKRSFPLRKSLYQGEGVSGEQEWFRNRDAGQALNAVYGDENQANAIKKRKKVHKRVRKVS